ncbi:Tetratricopeptide repeat superfamily protein [Perilla frutescens var. hirtella]|uniref:Tetratricopeptide repeat superfamily protein n=1 Tax=Perilla frutescens var. hirtella TaxID=608512 RepID=A0AAD4ISQ6_PERFH|nr:Tetratricopeptide repeat superfamily protein [Perilla frutescens var. hirtella]
MASTFMQQFAKKKTVLQRSSKKYLEEALYKKLLSDGGEEMHVRAKLNEFLKSRKSAYKWEVGRTVKILRGRKLYGPATKLSETMEKRGMNKTVSDQAIHLDLVAKSSGIAAAEAYFMALPESSKNNLTYSALLNCYCKLSMTSKAQFIFETMKSLNLEMSSMPYNSLMTLNLKNGLPQAVPALINEMKEGNIMPDIYTYNVWMRALAAMSDIAGVERVIDEMKRDGRVAGDWTTYSNLASIYADAGLFDKAEKALKELESRNVRREFSPYQFLITLYGRTGNLLEVYRVWRSLKLAFPKTANLSYLNMIQVLVKLNDLPGAEKCFQEWATAYSTGCSTFDIRIANVLIGAYLREGSLEKADKLRKQANRRGAAPNAKTWEHYIDYYLKKREFKSAVKCVDSAVTAGRANGAKWTPSPAVVEEFMRHFEQSKNVEAAEGFLEILKKSTDDVRPEIFEILIRTYAAAGKKSPILHRRVKMEKVELSEECKVLLDEISTE